MIWLILADPLPKGMDFFRSFRKADFYDVCLMFFHKTQAVCTESQFLRKSPANSA